ncbi:ABC transporter substrate-binding protein [Dissulfurispira thermophila]|uniref:ABC transporter substrate-binding protein n=1 Tax=Dissulfurispira thermophila TaxID=2715679 RepID=A0A7G1H0Y5_9BACT|nr:molybdate ABC transporter substrate-binding protein [Dissulfurispira thermophila]BCB95337.1 ABC transporter substrate-binding protein [Dissulfurispira thermophila]
MKSGLGLSLLLVFVCVMSISMVSAEQSLMVFAGAASKPPTEEAVKAFEKKTGVKVDVVFGGSGYVLSQMILSKKGDIYFPGSSDYMEVAKKKGVVYPETEKYVVYLVPAINVQKGNPKNIKTLKDLTRPGLKVAIANPEGVCVGAYAVEIIEKNFSAEEKAKFKKNLINYTESCEKTATAISLKAADAVIGWRVFHYWDPERIETIPLKKSEIVRVGYIPIAISKFTKNRGLAQRFIDFLLSEEGKAIYRKYNYFMTPDEAVAWIGEKKPVGGEYVVPKEWIKK